MIDNLSIILGHFPTYKKEVETLFVKDNGFMVLMNEYLLCKKEMKRLAEANKEKQAMTYMETINELEEELLAILEKQRLITLET